MKKQVNMDKFCVFILAHGRPESCKTFETLRECGYNGKIIILIDNEDDKAQGYFDMFGYDSVFVFNKTWAASKSDSMNNFGNRKAILFARNESFYVAEELGYDYFVQMDDDYYYFGHRGEYGAKKTNNLGLIFQWFIEFLVNCGDNVKSIAFSQGGDHIGGYRNDVLVKRKAMNSFFCITKRPFCFYGTLNDDVNCYLINGKKGDVFLTFMSFQLDQYDTQTTSGGMADTYKEMGTYLKSFTSIIGSPSNVKIKQMGVNFKRLHHSIDWNMTTPMIINETYKHV